MGPETSSTDEPLGFLAFLEGWHVEADGDDGGVVPFEMWPHIAERAKAWDSGSSEITLKARQLGISSLAQARAVYVAAVKRGNVLVISKRDVDSKDFGRKALVGYDALPADWRGRWPVSTRNTEEIAFANGGRIVMRAPTQDAGRSQANALVIIDEAAFHPYAKENYTAYRPTISAGGQLIVISTANGASGFFHDMYWSSKRGETPYAAHFIPWYARPGRDDAWLANERSAFAGLPGEFAQEYPATDAEAFVSHSGLVYGMDSDGVSIFDKRRNVQPAPAQWKEYKWRLGGADPGGTDPTACLAVGVTRDERVHVQAELIYRRGAISNMEIAERLFEAHNIAPFDMIVSDPSNTTLVEDCRRLGLPSFPADNSKAGRIAAVAMMLKTGRLTIDPRCTNLLREFESYFWAKRRDGALTSGDAVQTTTPADHHADALDVLGYICLALLRGLPAGGSGQAARLVVRR